MEIKPGYKQTEVGVIPKDWEVKKVGNVIDLLTGYPFPSVNYSTSGIRLMKGSNIKRGEIDWSQDITSYWPTITPDIKKYILELDDIVIAMDGSLVGKSFALVSNKDLPALLLQRVARLRSRDVSQKYLKEWICSHYFTQHCDSVKTVTAIPHISPEDIRSYRMPFPPTIEEQDSVANTLSDVDSLIQSLSKLIAKKRQIKQGTMQTLLNPYDENGHLKEGWKETPLIELSYLKGRIGWQGLKQSEFTDNRNEPCFNNRNEF